MDHTETFLNKTMVDEETVGFRFEADLFKAVPMIISLSVMDDTETFPNQNMVAAETVGF